MRTLPRPFNTPETFWADLLFHGVVFQILEGAVDPFTVWDVLDISTILDIDDFEFLVVIAGTDPKTADWESLNRLALEELIRYLEGDE